MCVMRYLYHYVWCYVCDVVFIHVMLCVGCGIYTCGVMCVMRYLYHTCGVMCGMWYLYHYVWCYVCDVVFIHVVLCVGCGINIYMCV